MAEVTINGWDKSSGKNHAGVIKLLKDFCGYKFETALKMSHDLIAGKIYKVQVPFAKRDELIRELRARGFNVS